MSYWCIVGISSAVHQDPNAHQYGVEREMPLQTYLDDVLRTRDGPWECYDAVVTATDIAELYRTGLLRVDPDRQRGIDPVSGKQVIDAKKIEVWTDELIAGTAIFGELSWNLRLPESEIQYDADQRRLRIVRGGATIPDSWHRHKAILQACESASRGSGFDLLRRFSVRIYHVSSEDEARIFYALNQEGRPADATRSKWLYPKETSARIARELVRRSSHLGAENVDTVRDRLSRRNPRLAAFNTLANAIASAWGDVQPTEEADILAYLLAFWDALVAVLPDLGRLDLASRRSVREASLLDSGVAIHAYIRLARQMQAAQTPFPALARLAESVDGTDGPLPFLSRANPEWARRGVLIPSRRRDGSVELTLRNARQSFEAMADAFTERVGVLASAFDGGGAGSPRATIAGATEKPATPTAVSAVDPQVPELVGEASRRVKPNRTDTGRARGRPTSGERADPRSAPTPTPAWPALSSAKRRPAIAHSVPIARAPFVEPTNASVAVPVAAATGSESVETARLVWRDVALAVLREKAAPMHYRDLYAAVVARGVTFGGRSPEATFLASISRDAEWFAGLGRGAYWIAGEPFSSNGTATAPPAKRRRPKRPRPIGTGRRS
jgi:hypothetical protein